MVHYSLLDATFGALSDSTRRGMLERLGSGPASVTELAQPFGISITGAKKHVQVLEQAQLVTTEKIGRTRICRLGPQTLDDASAWVSAYRSVLLGRLDRFAEVLEQHKETTP